MRYMIQIELPGGLWHTICYAEDLWQLIAIIDALLGDAVKNSPKIMVERLDNC